MQATSSDNREPATATIQGKGVSLLSMKESVGLMRTPISRSRIRTFETTPVSFFATSPQPARS